MNRAMLIERHQQERRMEGSNGGMEVWWIAELVGRVAWVGDKWTCVDMMVGWK